MTQETAKHKRLEALLAELSDGSFTERHSDELCELLAEGHDFVARYLSYLSLENLLPAPDVQRYVEALGAAAAGTPPPHTTPLRTKTDVSRFTSPRRALRWGAVAVAAAAACALVMAFYSPPAAVLVDGSRAHWKHGLSLLDGQSLEDAWIHLDQGTAKIAFRSGAEIYIQGPADLRVLNGNSCELSRGVLSADVPASAAGFQVRSAGATITDLGTAFRIRCDQSSVAELYVTEGAVELAVDGLTAPTTVSVGQIANWSTGSGPVVQSIGDLMTVLTGAVVPIAVHPPSLGYREFDHPSRVSVFLEQPFVQLRHDLAVSVAAPGRYRDFRAQGVLPSGSKLRSFMLHFAPGGVRALTNGSIRFAEPIVGIVCKTEHLNTANDELADGFRLKCFHPERGMESTPDVNSDELQLSADRRTLTFKFRTMSIDQMRILTRPN